MFKTIFLFSIYLLLQYESLFAQADSIPVSVKDTICYKYHFNTGDTLIYSVSSIDSIIINYGVPLLKNRIEKIRIICDSATKKGSFWLRQELIDYSCIEKQGGKDTNKSKEDVNDTGNINNTFSPWLKRIIRLEIDSLGKRLSYKCDDSTKEAMSPGGPFQPFLIIPIGQSCKALNESWIEETQFDLPENGIPIPIVNLSFLFRANKQIDTLTRKCNRLEFINTGQGSIRLSAKSKGLRVTLIINGYGVMDFDSQELIPVHLLSTVEQKLTIHISDDNQQPGLHYINTRFLLQEYKKGNPTLNNSKKAVPKKTKKIFKKRKKK